MQAGKHDVSTIQKLDGFASQLSQDIDLTKSTIIFLKGDLGSGKTTFVQHLLKHLMVKGHIPSPSYSLVNTYPSPYGQIAHADLYRLTSEEDLELIGWDMIIDTSKLIIVEWPELLDSTKPDLVFTLMLAGERRELTLSK